MTPPSDVGQRHRAAFSRGHGELSGRGAGQARLDGRHRFAGGLPQVPWRARARLLQRQHRLHRTDLAQRKRGRGSHGRFRVAQTVLQEDALRAGQLRVPERPGRGHGDGRT